MSAIWRQDLLSFSRIMSLIRRTCHNTTMYNRTPHPSLQILHVFRNLKCWFTVLHILVLRTRLRASRRRYSCSIDCKDTRYFTTPTHIPDIEPPSLQLNRQGGGGGSFLGIRSCGVTLTTHFNLVPRSGTSRTIPPLHNAPSWHVRYLCRVSSNAFNEITLTQKPGTWKKYLFEKFNNSPFSL